MTSSDSDFRLPFDRPWREALAIYGRSLMHFAVACLLGCVPILLCFVWVRGGPQILSAALALALAVVALVMVLRRRIYSAEARLESVVKAAEKSWEPAVKTVDVEIKTPGVSAGGTIPTVKCARDLRPHELKLYGGGEPQPLRPVVLIDPASISWDNLDRVCGRMAMLHGYLEEFSRVVPTPGLPDQPTGIEMVPETLIGLAQSRAHSWRATVDAMHRFQAITQDKPPIIYLDVMGRTIKEAAVTETIQFARIMEHTAWWVLRVQCKWMEDRDVKADLEENPFVIRDE